MSVVANVASPLEAEAALRAGAEGIGLVRTELLFLGRSTPPSVGEQRATYARILEVMGDRPVVFRTLDVGGDKPAEWQSATVEPNPALGVRGLRLGLRRPDLLDDQFAALLEAAAGARAAGDAADGLDARGGRGGANAARGGHGAAGGGGHRGRRRPSSSG